VLQVRIYQDVFFLVIFLSVLFRFAFNFSVRFVFVSSRTNNINLYSVKYFYM